MALYYLLSLMAGMLISVMVVANGGLGERLGLMGSAVVIHAVGLGAISLVLLAKRERPRLLGLPAWLYLGGLLGVLTILFNNYAFTYISVSAMMALALLGDSISGLIADHFGLLGMQKRPFQPRKTWGLLLTMAGIAVMMDGFAFLPMLVSLLAGMTILLSRLINARLGQLRGTATSTLCNYLVGLVVCLALTLVLRQPLRLDRLSGVPPFALAGGAMGAGIVLLSTYIVPRISSYYMALSLFVGQVAASLMLDAMRSQRFPWPNLWGCLLVLCGLSLNLWQDRKQQTAAEEQAA